MSSSLDPIPSLETMRAETLTLSGGWVVGWSRSNHRRFYARPPSGGRGEEKIWDRPPLAVDRVVVPPEPPRPVSPTYCDESVSYPSSSPSFPAPVFTAWVPASASSLAAEQAALDASAGLALASSRSRQAEKDSAKALAEKEREQFDAYEDEAAKERENKRRKVGLGFGAPSSSDAASSSSSSSSSSTAADPVRKGMMKFVSSSSSGSSSYTPAPSSASSSSSSSAESLLSLAARLGARILPSDPGRLESASLPKCTVANPPVYATSLQACRMLSERGTSVARVATQSTEWDDKDRYQDVFGSSKTITINSVYGVKQLDRMDEYLASETELPKPIQTRRVEESPLLINARRHAFNEIDLHLTSLIVSAGLREQPSMAFLRWGFNQRSLQNPALSQSDDGSGVDPLLPVESSPFDTCLATELIKAGMVKAKAHDVCQKLSVKCNSKARELIAMKNQIESSADAQPPIKQFTLLFPNESHRHSFASSASSSSSSSAKPTHQSYRHRDLVGQDAASQYKLIYDFGGAAGSEHAIPLNLERFTQLQRDYTRVTGPIGADVKKDQVFLRRMWTMMARYDTISGSGYQAALPEDAFMILRDHFGVQHECYASPLNHCLDSFGSAFVETDHYFGSKGSFLDQRPLEGGFEANPPFLEEVMAPMAMHVLALIERAQVAGTPLCFVVIWPGWDDTPAYDLLMTSRFMQKLIVFEKFDHSYKDGLQHRVTSSSYRQSRARSFVFFMQSDAAKIKWPVTKDNMTKFKQAFMQKR